MLKLGKVETYIHEKLEREKLHFVLLDPDDVSPPNLQESWRV